MANNFMLRLNEPNIAANLGQEEVQLHKGKIQCGTIEKTQNCI